MALCAFKRGKAMHISDRPITTAEVEHDYPMVAGLLEYFRWLAEQDDRFPLVAGQIATFYEEYIRKGRYPSEVAEDLGLPAFPDW
jgi:hypothetical protein